MKISELASALTELALTADDGERNRLYDLLLSSASDFMTIEHIQARTAEAKADLEAVTARVRMLRARMAKLSPSSMATRSARC